MTTTTARDAILYLRLSEVRDLDLDGDGIERTLVKREAQLTSICESWGWRVVRVIRENDLTAKGGRQRGASAYKRKPIRQPNGETIYRVVRKGFSELLAALKAGQANAVMCEDLDRMLRDNYDSEDLMQIAMLQRVECRSVSGTLTLTDGGNDHERDMCRMWVWHAARSSADTARRVRAGRARKAQGREWGGGVRPFGYRPVGKFLEIDPAEAEIIRSAVKRLLRKKNPWTLGQLAAELRAKDVPTVNGGMWSAETLRGVLLRPRHAGIEIHRGEEIGETSHKGIIPVSTFREVQRVLTDPARRTCPGGREPRWLGSGIFRCGRCDGLMYVSGSGAGRKPRYVCKNYGHVGRLVSQVDPVVIGALTTYVGEQRGWSLRLVKSDEPMTDLAELQEQRRTLRRRLDNLAVDYSDELIDRSQMREASARGRRRLDQLDEKIREHFADDSVTRTLFGSPDVKVAFEGMPLTDRRAALSELLSVTILPVGRTGRSAPAEAIRIVPAGKGAEVETEITALGTTGVGVA